MKNYFTSTKEPGSVTVDGRMPIFSKDQRDSNTASTSKQSDAHEQNQTNATKENEFANLLQDDDDLELLGLDF